MAEAAPAKPSKKHWKRKFGKKKPAYRQASSAVAEIQEFYEYLYVWEFSPGMWLVAKEKNGVDAADIYVPKMQKWVDFSRISRDDLKKMIEEELDNKMEHKK